MIIIFRNSILSLLLDRSLFSIFVSSLPYSLSFACSFGEIVDRDVGEERRGELLGFVQELLSIVAKSLDMSERITFYEWVFMSIWGDLIFLFIFPLLPPYNCMFSLLSLLTLRSLSSQRHGKIWNVGDISEVFRGKERPIVLFEVSPSFLLRACS